MQSFESEETPAAPRLTAEELHEAITLWQQRHQAGLDVTTPPAVGDLAEALGITVGEAQQLLTEIHARRSEEERRQREQEAHQAEAQEREARLRRAEAEARRAEAEARWAEAQAVRVSPRRRARTPAQEEVAFGFHLALGFTLLLLLLWMVLSAVSRHAAAPAPGQDSQCAVDGRPMPCSELPGFVPEER